MFHNKIAAHHRAIYRYLEANQTDSEPPRNEPVKIIRYRLSQSSPEFADVREETLRWLERQRRQAKVRGSKS